VSDIDWAEIRRLFDRICELSPEHWQQALDSEGASPALAAEVIALCDAQTRGVGLPRAVAGMLATLDPELAPGTRLGPWRIVSTLAEGGMGRVYVAERADGQYQLKVAIKRLRELGAPGEDAMLRRERQILADLVHPNIARLLDGGMTPNGQPHLVMEFIEGERVDHWCARQQLGLVARLRLFQQVCRAVAFAHRHLVLHCDLKPSNILVRNDGTPVLLDFGIARLIDTESRDSGAAGYMTPRYASPEQKRRESLSAASDIYSLGLILSELVAPASTADRTGEALSENPPTLPPSARAQRTGVAWATRLRGDLDAIVLQACAAAPQQRYASADALADDIQRHLERRPVQPRAHRALYRLRRLLQRRWVAFVAAGAFIAMAASFTHGLSTQLERARTAERVARVQADNNREVLDFLLSVFEHADPTANSRADITARELLDSGRKELEQGLRGQPQLQMHLALTLGQIYERIGLPVEAMQLLRQAEALAPADIEVEDRLALLDALVHGLWTSGEEPEAARLAREALALAEARLDPNHPALANALNSLGIQLINDGFLQEAEALLLRALPIRLEAFGRNSIETASTLHNLGMVNRLLGRLDVAEDFLTQSLAAKSGLVPEDHPRMLTTLQLLARVAFDRGELTHAEQSLRLLRDMRIRRHGEGSTRVADARNELAGVLQDLGRYPEAEAEYRAALAINAAVRGADASDSAIVVNNLASLLEARGALDEALPLLMRSLRIRTAALGAKHASTARAHNNLARVLVQLGRIGEARTQVEHALQIRIAQFGEANAETLGSRIVLAQVTAAEGDPAQARAQLAVVTSDMAALAVVDPNLRLRLLQAQAELAAAAAEFESELGYLREGLAVVRAGLSAEHPLAAELQLRIQALLPPDQRDRAEIERATQRLRDVLAPAHRVFTVAAKLQIASGRS
jgi:serine/threonine protein kinase/Tfp pilus assembly protein PilF